MLAFNSKIKSILFTLLTIIIASCSSTEIVYNKSGEILSSTRTKDIFRKTFVYCYDKEDNLTKKVKISCGKSGKNKTQIREVWEFNLDGSISNYELLEWYNAAYKVIVREI